MNTTIDSPSAPTTSAGSGAHAATDEHAGLVHPSDKKYVIIALVLAGITSFEIALYYLEDDLGRATAPLLIAGSILKFTLVVGYFMHLKFDVPIVKRIFIAGVVMSVVYFGAVLLSMGAIFGTKPQTIPSVEPAGIIRGN